MSLFSASEKELQIHRVSPQRGPLHYALTFSTKNLKEAMVYGQVGSVLNFNNQPLPMTLERMSEVYEQYSGMGEAGTLLWSVYALFTSLANEWESLYQAHRRIGSALIKQDYSDLYLRKNIENLLSTSRVRYSVGGKSVAVPYVKQNIS